MLPRLPQKPILGSTHPGVHLQWPFAGLSGGRSWSKLHPCMDLQFYLVTSKRYISNQTFPWSGSQGIFRSLLDSSRGTVVSRGRSYLRRSYWSPSLLQYSRHDKSGPIQSTGYGFHETWHLCPWVSQSIEPLFHRFVRCRGSAWYKRVVVG